MAWLTLKCLPSLHPVAWILAPDRPLMRGFTSVCVTCSVPLSGLVKEPQWSVSPWGLANLKHLLHHHPSVWIWESENGFRNGSVSFSWHYFLSNSSLGAWWGNILMLLINRDKLSYGLRTNINRYVVSCANDKRRQRKDIWYLKQF